MFIVSFDHLAYILNDQFDIDQITQEKYVYIN